MSILFKSLENFLNEIGAYQIATKDMSKRSYKIKIYSKEHYTVINNLEVDSFERVKKGFVNMGMFTNEFGSVEKIKISGFENIEEIKDLLIDIKEYSPIKVLHRLNKLKSRNIAKHMNRNKFK